MGIFRAIALVAKMLRKRQGLYELIAQVEATAYRLQIDSPVPGVGALNDRGQPMAAPCLYVRTRPR